jgi:hypothetical protein
MRSPLKVPSTKVGICEKRQRTRRRAFGALIRQGGKRLGGGPARKVQGGVRGGSAPPIPKEKSENVREERGRENRHA